MRGEWIEIGRLTSCMSLNGGLSPCGESGLKLGGSMMEEQVQSLSPCGESGLKFIVVVVPIPYTVGLSPCGESGLKLILLLDGILSVQSLPMRGEWIEIFRPSVRP